MRTFGTLLMVALLLGGFVLVRAWVYAARYAAPTATAAEPAPTGVDSSAPEADEKNEYLFMKSPSSEMWHNPPATDLHLSPPASDTAPIPDRELPASLFGDIAAEEKWEWPPESENPAKR